MKEKQKQQMIAVVAIIFCWCLSLFFKWDFKDFPVSNITQFVHPKLQMHVNDEVMSHHYYTYLYYDQEPFTNHKFLSHHGPMIYPSFTSTVFVLPYITAKIIDYPLLEQSHNSDLQEQLKATKYFLEGFSSIILLIITLLLYYCMRLLLSKFFATPHGASIHWAALGTSIAFLFHVNVLVNFFHVYWAHQLFLIPLLCFLIRFIKTDGKLRPIELVLFSWVMSSIVWYGLLFSFFVCIYYIVTYIKTKDSSSLLRAGMVCLGVSAFMIIYLYRYINEMGYDTYIDWMTLRFSERTYSGHPHLTTIGNIKNILIDTSVYVVAGVALLLFGKKNIRLQHRALLFPVILFLGIAPIVENATFMDHNTQYGFGRLFIVLSTIIFFGIGIFSAIQNISRKTAATILICVSLVLCSLYSILLYRELYSPIYWDEYVKVKEDTR